MKKKILIVIMSLGLSLFTYAQASGGQIVRPDKSHSSSATYRKKSTSKPHSSQAQTEQSVEMPHNTFSQTKQSVTSHTKPAIQPIFISDLQKYNVVVSSYNILANAQNECQTIRDDGFFSNIYLDSSKIYRVLMYMGTNNENEAKAMRNKVRERFPAAWIMCVENDRTFRFE